ncbi:MAG TPA: MFS transporter [Anaerolineae bacterium]|nr:MFS transporter [Anaerolineae bacterium]
MAQQLKVIGDWVKLCKSFAGGIFSYFCNLGNSLSVDAGTLTILAILFIAGGVLQAALAYMIEKRDRRVLQLGTAIMAALGAALLFVAYKSGGFSGIYWRTGVSSITGQILNPLTVGLVDLVSAFILYRNPEVQAWFRPGPSPSEIRRMQEADRWRRIDEENRRLAAALAAAQAAAGRQAPIVDPTIYLPSAQPHGYLVNRTRGGSVQPIPLPEWSKLGRKPECTIKTHTPTSGREHAVISYEGAQYYITDMNTKAGTYVNGQRITAKRQLFGNDEIRMGEDVFVFMQAPPERR